MSTSASAEKFAQLLSEGVHRVRIRESKTVQIVQDELGYAVGRQGGSSVEYWRKGHIPPKYTDVEILARELVRRGGLGPEWLMRFLESTGHPNPAAIQRAIFPDLEPGERTVPQAGGHSVIQEAFGLSLANGAPFVAGPPIRHPRNFFGRERELGRLFGLWKRLPLQNAAIIGRRRSGKTSLLHYLSLIGATPEAELRPGQRREWLPQPGIYRWILVDFQDARMVSRERLLRYLLSRLDLPIPEPCSLGNFMDIVSDHLKEPTIILMDEIGVALAAPELDQQFWWSLRSLGTNQTGGKLGFVLAAQELPSSLAHEHGKPSPFFNIFGHTISLGPFRRAAAQELIASSPIPFDEKDNEWILEQSGLWPVLLQIVCHTRLSALEQGRRDDEWREEALQQIAPFRYMFNE